MADGGNLIKSEQISKLINAVQSYAHDIQQAGVVLSQASELCRQECSSDDLSVAYTNTLDALLNDLASGVFPKLEELIDGLIEEKKRLDEVTRT